MYSANVNPTNPIGTVQSIEYTLRSLDRLAAEQQQRLTRVEKELADYQSQADRPFEHDERLKQLLVRQAELTSMLDLDKGDQQGADSGPDLKTEPEVPRITSEKARPRESVAKMAEAYMRTSGTAIRDIPITERTPPKAGPVTGRAVARDDTHIAIATAANSFFVLPSSSVGQDVQIGERLSLRFNQGRPLIDSRRSQER
jgi:hypothetical protein